MDFDPFESFEKHGHHHFHKKHIRTATELNITKYPVRF